MFIIIALKINGWIMLFNSHEFIFLFLPVTFFVYFFLNKKRLTEAAKGFLVASSLFFYSWWNIAYLPLIVGSMIFNYSFGLELCKNNPKISKKLLLALGIAANLALLGYFKYSDFFDRQRKFRLRYADSASKFTPAACDFIFYVSADRISRRLRGA